MTSRSEEFIPKWIAWETTQRCNLNCVHCRCSSEMTSSEGDFTTEEAYKLIDDICEISKPVMVLSGGEPLLRPDIFEIARYGTSRGLRMCMATNGVLITDEVCARMKEADIKMVSLSLDGSTAEVHDNFRNCPGAFEGTVRGAETLKRNGIKFLVNSSFTKRNQHDIGATFHYQQERMEDDILMRPTCAPHYYRIVPQMAKSEGVNFERRSLTFSTGGGKGCIAAQTICLIDCFGNLKPCSYFHSSVGNVKQVPFKELWFNAKVFNDLRDFARYKGKCGECEFINVCGGCRARADAVYGDYMEEEPFCSYLPLRTRKRMEKEAAELAPENP
ncbi:MAG: radical SAM protein [Desulfuromonadales bacterium]